MVGPGPRGLSPSHPFCCANHCVQLLSSTSDALRSPGLHPGNLVDIVVLVVRGLLTHLPSCVKVTGPHDDATFAEPLPVARWNSVDRLAFGPNTAILVVDNLFLRLSFFLCHRAAFRRGVRVNGKQIGHGLISSL